jgi:coenzyme F420 biosynthesis associated uncharacterized protein
MPGPVDWRLAERVALRLAGREPLAESYHYGSLAPDFDELTAQAEELVAAATGLRSLAGPARARVVGRDDWVRANLASFQRLLAPLLQKLDEQLASRRMPSGVTRTLAGAELGALLGWMSSRVLGQYDLLVIDDDTAHQQDLVYYVGPNLLALEKRFGFPPREFRLWLALHEVTHRAQFTGIPWMRQHFLGLVQDALGSVDPDPTRFLEAVKAAMTDGNHRRQAMQDGGLVALLATPEQRIVLNRIGGLMSLLEGHGDVTMDRAGAGHVPSAERFSRVLRDRRSSQGAATRLLQKLTGVEAKLAQYEQGEKFIACIEAVSGPSLIDRCWASADNLPTLDEIRSPDQWLARLGIAAAVA